MRPNSSGSRKTWMLAALVASGLFLVQRGALPFWIWAVVAAVAVGMRLLGHVDRYQDELLLSDEGLSRRHGSKLRRTSVESVRWDDLVKVDALANETGAGRKELLFLLYGSTGNGVAVPDGVATAHQLVPILERRLPGFRSDALAQARSSAERRSWTLWERAGAPGTGL